MPRNMSFSLTTSAVRNRTKTVTRRLGWDFLRPGDLLMACEKCQGLGKGGRVVRLGLIRVVSVRREPLVALLLRLDCEDELRREGFPGINVSEFWAIFFKDHTLGWQALHDKARATWVNRIEFEYAEEWGRE